MNSSIADQNGRIYQTQNKAHIEGEFRMAQQPQDRPKTRYVERIEIGETFTDQVENAAVSDGCLRITFSTTRWPIGPDAGSVGERVTVSRLVMPVKAAIELHNSLTRLMAQLEQHGVVKSNKPSVLQSG